MPKVGIYCRLSIEDKDKSGYDDSRSIQNQKSMLRDYCHERNWEIFDIYCDDGYSGIDRSRPAFNKLLYDCEKRCIDIVLCKDQSRFSRDIVVIEQYINDRFLEWGIRFIGVADNADSDSEIYGTMRLFTSAYNEMYVKDISSKIRRTLAYKREQGQFIGSFAPYGYKIDDADKHHLVVDEETAPVVQRIFELYSQGAGYRIIVNELNEKDIPSPSAYKKKTGSNYSNHNADSAVSKGLWTQSTIASILRNEMYTGTLVQGKSHNISYKNKKRKKVNRENWIRIPQSHEEIVDTETWSIVQERLNSHTRSSRISQELSALSGKVKCAVCGRPMKRNVYYNKSRTIQYYGLQCASYKTGAMNCPNTKSISGKVLEKHILDELNSIIETYCQAENIEICDIYSQQIESLEKQKTALESKLKFSQNRITIMYKDRLDGIISEDDFIMFRKNLSEEEKLISSRISDIESQISELNANRLNAENKKSLIKKYSRFTTLTRSISEEFIDFIEIGEVQDNGERIINIHWKI